MTTTDRPASDVQGAMSPKDEAIAGMFWGIFESAREAWLDHLDEKYPLAAMTDEEREEIRKKS